jgi:hypothetical protein
VQADPNEYSQLNLRAHSLLADVQLHDVWLAELEGGGPGRTIADALFCFTPQIATSANAAVKRLFAIRRVVGRISGWDRNVSRWDDELYSHRLTDEDRERSRIKPGTPDQIFRTVYVFENEALSEVRNATVHAFSSLALRETLHGYRLYWAMYVKPIGPWTSTYMRVIDPFRRAIIYPAVINRITNEWRTRYGDNPS